MRPCQDLINLWNSVDRPNSPFRFEIIPFNDDSTSLNNMFDSIGQTIDCFVGPCDFKSWPQRYSIQQLGYYPSCVAVSRKHKLTLAYLNGETLGLLKTGKSATLDQLRAELQTNHPQIIIKDLDHFYGMEVFNECDRGNYFIESLTAWQNIHPNIVTISVKWDYQIPYGIVYSKHPSEAMQELIKELVK